MIYDLISTKADSCKISNRPNGYHKDVKIIPKTFPSIKLADNGDGRTTFNVLVEIAYTITFDGLNDVQKTAEIVNIKQSHIYKLTFSELEVVSDKDAWTFVDAICYNFEFLAKQECLKGTYLEKMPIDLRDTRQAMYKKLRENNLNFFN